ncbi:ABC transporter ATP-binding protein [Egicoccus halophilus]|uniref:Multidrug ABC transporter ATP-binding protein n=1 Tax=Egicoccus halophilus TaxID=1670830 RepID=A0A8J3AAY4_9ACTN|nr:ABC transporter ATP-binding protein [Egicoccus halophilus]GGI06827.1 multidrug ABC transporter ATP-binding protein [Egicoccus halophilus]
MSATTTSSTVTPTPPEGAWRTLVRGISLSPELRTGLPATLLLALLATAGRAIVPIAVQRTIDDGLGGAGGGVDLGAVTTAVVLAGIAVLITAAASGWMNWRLATVVETALSNLRVRAFRHIHDLSMLHQATQQRGSLTARVTSDIDEISRFMQWAGLNLITATGQLTVSLLVMLYYSWQLTLVVLVVFLPFLFVARAFQVRLTAAYLAVRERVGHLLGALAETVVGAPVVRAYGIERRTQRRLDGRIEDHRSAAIRAGRLSALFSGSGEVFAGVATAGAVATGVFLGIDGDLTPGTVLAFLFLIALFVEPVLMATEVINEGQTAVAGWRRVLDVLDLDPDVADPADDGVDLPDGPIGVTFDHVAFRYPRVGESGRDASGPLVLRDVHLDIVPQTRVAVVGETGSGKTTFAKLLTRLMDPSEGRVLLAGTDLRRVRFDSLRRRVVMVPQDGMLFDGTIASNVRQGQPSIDDDDLELAMVELGLADWVAELPQGLQTRVGERGNALSAGERQLVALARAYVANPDLLVLDEATSAVDPATEVRLQRALVGLTSGRTTITIAHRLSTAEAADEVLVFDGGELVERGPHGDLVDGGGIYAGLHASWRAGTHSR